MGGKNRKSENTQINKICFALGHPAHFHLYKYVIQELAAKGIEIYIVIREKDILKNLLDNINLTYISIEKSNSTSKETSKLLRLLKSSISFFKVIVKIKPDLIIGCLSQIGITGFLLRIPTVFNAEDDIDYTFLQAITTYPFVKHILTPFPTNTGLFKYKRIPYDGYHKLAYLHPSRFTPEREKVDIPSNENYFIIRISKLNAYHDTNAEGITDLIAQKLIQILNTKGRVLISSERELPSEFDKYRFNGRIEDIHHYLFYATLFVGDSQSMSVESSLLGTPNIRFNNFVGKINVLNELEHKYNLTKGIKTSELEMLLFEVESMTSDPGIKHKYKENRHKLLKDKIDVTAFMVWFIENYPNCINTLRKNPNNQYYFR